MAAKKNILRKLSNVQKYINLFTQYDSKNWQLLIVQNLTAARNYCKYGLPVESYPAYEELYDVLISTVQEIIQGEISAKSLSICREMVSCIEEQTVRETGFKKEAVFLPYQASMWDSLETIWEAGQADEEWNTFVIPLPYCERNRDWKAVKWCCDRDKFPDNVPTLSWESVDLYEWHPDVIYIHNPYDEYNYVTSVDERFYSSNLKLCTDKLVYVPYFILSEPDFSVSENPLEGHKELIATPAAENADVIIAQSENMREAMIRLLLKEKGGERKYWEDKILGIGSPKLDKLSSGRKDYDLPEAWTRLMGDNKVVLYNTGIAEALKHRKKYLRKIRSALNTFHEHKDVTLWWRPHPLLDATFGAFSPALQQEYEDIVAKYIEEGWGIFDDTPYLNRAIACTDAYYGDRSSLIHMYKLLKKPIMIQDILVVNDLAD